LAEGRLYDTRMPPYFHRVAACALFSLATAFAAARQFDVMVYNVENLFDADGVALFEDYLPGNLENPSPYSPRKLLTKIQNIARVAQGFNEGAGPEIILFQEFELDRTPESTVDFNNPEFLEKYSGTTVEEMLTTGFNHEIAGLPVAALTLKYFEDHGLTGYQVALPEHAMPLEEAPAHTNAIFTKFPIRYQKAHPTPSARVIQEAGVTIDGAELIIFNNHWKSGASNPGTESRRARNARDLRKAVEAVIVRNPSADVLVGGDLNTYYNAKQHFPREHPESWGDVREFAIDELGSQGDERATRRGERMLYNLWFELPPDQRGSELYRGAWGTLMQILITPGLYDGQGVSYVDNSFRVLRVPGLNAAGPWNAPIPWYFSSESGGGFGDHFPLAATFTTETPPPFGPPSHTRPHGPPEVPTVDYGDVYATSVPAFQDLAGQPLDALVKRFGDVFVVEGELVYRYPFIVRAGDRHYEIYSYNEEIVDELARRPLNREIRFIGQFDEYRGNPQFVIHHEDWLK